MSKAQTGAPNDLRYREQFTEALVAAGCSLENARPGLSVAAARAAHESGLSAELAVKVYQALDWRRIGSHHNGYIAAAFRGELEIAKHRALDQSKRENVSLPIEQKYQLAVDQKSGPREYSAEEWLAAEDVMRQLREFDASQEKEKCPDKTTISSLKKLGDSFPEMPTARAEDMSSAMTTAGPYCTERSATPNWIGHTTRALSGSLSPLPTRSEAVALRANGARHGPGKEFLWSAITARAG